ncbi:hypothetical protein [Kamptonema sp. UHCC 0994]|uniref:DUF937 domain-containing protein n=1 Tax=Kamptonema sp. UHCC 0994 TaxID=3031329 RepID=UPI0023BA34D4|nr:hypothetical protein [Kamptonema sp. UHCC 0994]MDF0551958.1 hypothetical protein [Kamptonema sp. UHCC 0994]
MGLFDQILGAIENPNQQASPNQLDNIVGTVQQLGNNYGVDLGTAQMAVSMLGGYVRSALQDVRSQSGNSQAEAIVNQYSGTTPNIQAVQSLFNPNQVTQIAQAIAQRTGIDEGTIQAMIPVLIPLVLNLLQMGSNAQNPQSGQNSLLSSFLDADGDNDVDIGDAMMLAGRFLNQPR